MSTSPYTLSQVDPSLPKTVSQAADASGHGLPSTISTPISACGQDLDVTKRDRFELLSAYLDGEVTPSERQLVLCWLQTDDSARCLYNRLLSLRHGLRTQTAPLPCDTNDTLVGVSRALNHRLKLIAMACAGVAAIGTINLLSGSTGGGYGPWRTASEAQPDVLQVALDRPAFPIPDVVPVSTDADSALDAGIIPVESEL